MQWKVGNSSLVPSFSAITEKTPVKYLLLFSLFILCITPLVSIVFLVKALEKAEEKAPKRTDPPPVTPMPLAQHENIRQLNNADHETLFKNLKNTFVCQDEAINALQVHLKCKVFNSVRSFFVLPGAGTKAILALISQHLDAKFKVVDYKDIPSSQRNDLLSVIEAIGKTGIQEKGFVLLKNLDRS